MLAWGRLLVLVDMVVGVCCIFSFLFPVGAHIWEVLRNSLSVYCSLLRGWWCVSDGCVREYVYLSDSRSILLGSGRVGILVSRGIRVAVS